MIHHEDASIPSRPDRSAVLLSTLPPKLALETTVWISGTLVRCREISDAATVDLYFMMELADLAGILCTSRETAEPPESHVKCKHTQGSLSALGRHAARIHSEGVSSQ
jgi:hypothetical protein